MSYLVLANPSDATAVRLALLLRQRNPRAEVRVHTPYELILAGWDHRVGETGVASVLRLRDGTCLTHGEAMVVFNRLSRVDVPMFEQGSAADREYAGMEMFALLLSWLTNPAWRVINRPTDTSLGGAAYRPLVWQAMAQRAGLRCRRLGATTSTRRFPLPDGTWARDDIGFTTDPLDAPHGNRFTWYAEPISDPLACVFIIGDAVIGDPPETVARACRGLAAICGLDFVRIDFARSTSPDQDWMFVGANSSPDLDNPETLLALAIYLESVAGGGVIAQ